MGKKLYDTKTLCYGLNEEGEYMKKSRIVWIGAVLCIVALCASLFAYWTSFHKIDPDKVEIIRFGNDPVSEVFGEEDTAKFIKLFNAARYKEEDIGYGTTPDIMVCVYFHDGSYMIINEYGNGNFHVSVRNGDGDPVDNYFVNSKVLQAFALEWLD